MKKILKNQHEERITAQNEELSDARLSRTIEKQLQKANKPYSHQWKDWYMGTKLFSYLANGFSSITQAFALFMFASGTIMNTAALLGIGVLSVTLAILIEFLKRGSVDKSMFSYVWQKELKPAYIGKWLFMMAISIGASFYACTQLPKFYSNVASPIPTIDSTSIIQPFAEQIAIQKSILASQQSETKSDGRLRYGVSSKIDKTNAKLDSLHQAQSNALSLAYDNYQYQVTNQQKEDEQMGYLLAYFSIAIELLFALALWYESNYLYKCALERSLLKEQSETTPLPPQPNFDTIVQQENTVIPHHAPEARRPIGFHHALDTSANTDKQTVCTNPTKDANTVCNNDISSANSVCTEPKGTITHYDFNTGKPKEMSVRDIKRMLAIYDSRIAEREKELEQRGLNKEKDKVLLVRKVRASYWHHLLATLEGRLILHNTSDIK